ncbi:MAG: hypothetical protein AAGE92_01475 [Cyanobacteria bacterium P01_G01_bin.4]
MAIRDGGGKDYELRDYNGTGIWSASAIIERYSTYAKLLGVEEPRTIKPSETVSKNGAVKWVYPVMDAIVAGIREGDRACVEIGVEFIEHCQKQPFGRLLHSNTARVLRQQRHLLTGGQINRLRNRILQMLLDEQIPHEYKEYSKLLKRIGFGAHWEAVQAAANRDNRYVRRYLDYFEMP